MKKWIGKIHETQNRVGMGCNPAHTLPWTKPCFRFIGLSFESTGTVCPLHPQLVYSKESLCTFEMGSLFCGRGLLWTRTHVCYSRLSRYATNKASAHQMQEDTVCDIAMQSRNMYAQDKHSNHSQQEQLVITLVFVSVCSCY